MELSGQHGPGLWLSSGAEPSGPYFLVAVFDPHPNPWNQLLKKKPKSVAVVHVSISRLLQQPRAESSSSTGGHAASEEEKATKMPPSSSASCGCRSVPWSNQGWAGGSARFWQDQITLKLRTARLRKLNFQINVYPVFRVTYLYTTVNYHPVWVRSHKFQQITLFRFKWEMEQCW